MKNQAWNIIEFFSQGLRQYLHECPQRKSINKLEIIFLERFIYTRLYPLLESGIFQFHRFVGIWTLGIFGIQLLGCRMMYIMVYRNVHLPIWEMLGNVGKLAS